MYGGNNWGNPQPYRNPSPPRGPWQRGPPPGLPLNLPRPVPASGSGSWNQSNASEDNYNSGFRGGQPDQQNSFNQDYGKRPRYSEEDAYARPSPVPAAQFPSQSHFGSNQYEQSFHEGQQRNSFNHQDFESQSKYESNSFIQGAKPESNYNVLSNNLNFESQEDKPSTSKQHNFRKDPYAGPKMNEPKDDYIFKDPDQDPDFDDNLIHLDWYNSDLNMDIDCNDYCSVRAMSSQGFGYMWSGIRATYGVTKGKVCYEVKITSNQPADHLENETHPHVIRVGWSLDTSSLQLGTENFSYGFGGTGKASTNNKFLNYGRPFGLNDVIGCYLDLTSTPMTIAYTVNGNFLGIAFRFHRHELNGKPLFPHIMTKNQDFLVNFGQLPNSLARLNPKFTMIGHLDTIQDGLVRATKSPETKADCEVIQMVGLPGAGKTYWANQLCKDRPEKRYNILGTNTLIDKMKVMGLTRNRNYAGRWDALITKCTECFNVLLRRAMKRKRNFILDQTNVYPTARMRKMRDFLGYKIQTIIVVPEDQEYLRRCRLRAQEEGKEVPADALLNMKANFLLPDISETYGEVFYVELNPEAAAEQIKTYNQEARNAGCKMNSGVEKMAKRERRKRKQLNDFRPNGKMWPFNIKSEESPIPSTSSAIDDNFHVQEEFQVKEEVPVKEEITVKEEIPEERRNQRDRSRSPIRNRNNAPQVQRPEIVSLAPPRNAPPFIPYGYGNFRVPRQRGPPPDSFRPYNGPRPYYGGRAPPMHRPRFHPYYGNPRMF